LCADAAPSSERLTAPTFSPEGRRAITLALNPPSERRSVAASSVEEIQMSATQQFDLQRVQKLRKAALLAGLMGVVGLAFISRSIGGETMLHEGLEAFGLGLIVV